jgi:hypothetical protein
MGEGALHPMVTPHATSLKDGDRDRTMNADGPMFETITTPHGDRIAGRIVAHRAWHPPDLPVRGLLRLLAQRMVAQPMESGDERR